MNKLPILNLFFDSSEAGDAIIDSLSGDIEHPP